jgi:hypothetical protein
MSQEAADRRPRPGLGAGAGRRLGSLHRTELHAARGAAQVRVSAWVPLRPPRTGHRGPVNASAAVIRSSSTCPPAAEARTTRARAGNQSAGVKLHQARTTGKRPVQAPSSSRAQGHFAWSRARSRPPVEGWAGIDSYSTCDHGPWPSPGADRGQQGNGPPQVLQVLWSPTVALRQLVFRASQSGAGLQAASDAEET